MFSNLNGENMLASMEKFKGGVNSVANFAPVVKVLYDNAPIDKDKPWLKDLRDVTPNILQERIIAHLQDKYKDRFEPESVRSMVLQTLSASILETTLQRCAIAWSYLDVGKMAKIPQCCDDKGSLMMALVSSMDTGTPVIKTGSESGPIPGVKYTLGSVLMDNIAAHPESGIRRTPKDAMKFRLGSGNKADDVLSRIAIECIIREPLVPEQCGPFRSAWNLMTLELPGIKVPGTRPTRISSIDMMEDL